MKNSLLSILAVIAISLCFNGAANAQDQIVPLKKETQVKIIKDLSNAYSELAKTSIPIGGDTETEWAAMQVDSLKNALNGSQLPFLRQYADIYRMNALYAYGLNYAPSMLSAIIIMDDSSLSDWVKIARLGPQYCDAITAEFIEGGYKDILALAESSTYAHASAQVYLTLINRLNGNKEYQDSELGFPINLFTQFEDICTKKIFSERDLAITHLVFEAICFFKIFCNQIGHFACTQNDVSYLKNEILEYANYIDAVASPIFQAAASTAPVSFNMTDKEFETFMLTCTAIKVDMLQHLTQQFQIIIANEQQQQ